MVAAAAAVDMMPTSTLNFPGTIPVVKNKIIKPISDNLLLILVTVHTSFRKEDPSLLKTPTVLNFKNDKMAVQNRLLISTLEQIVNLQHPIMLPSTHYKLIEVINL
ncbi:hypothetical protein DQG23_19440 [Paenibacillus contaminans]|uniref:Uncharacterized protein n=1 Tax=Paenibacillus contaminans TaxID=450362 RepID=A0A329MJ97_9BACL|nr:hypothetical protein DQG23_19440 [Paenibacillus contaminans]